MRKGDEQKMLQNGKEFKITIRSARVNKGLTQEQASKELGIHKTTLLRWEKDSSCIPTKMVEKMLELYDVPFDHIFLGKCAN